MIHRPNCILVVPNSARTSCIQSDIIARNGHIRDTIHPQPETTTADNISLIDVECIITAVRADASIRSTACNLHRLSILHPQTA